MNTLKKLCTFCKQLKRSAASASFTTFGQFRQSSSSANDFEDLDKPIKFTTSKASQWKASQTLSGDPFPYTWRYTPQSVIASTSAFLLYFLWLREENDIDELMDEPIWTKVDHSILTPEIVEKMIEIDKSWGLDVSKAEKDLVSFKKTWTK